MIKDKFIDMLTSPNSIKINEHKFLKEFINYLKRTNDSSWCLDVVKAKDRNCLMGHLNDYVLNKFWDWFEERVSSTYVIYPINDGESDKYKQSTPKERCIAYLENILTGDEDCTYEGMRKEYEMSVKAESKKKEKK